MRQRRTVLLCAAAALLIGAAVALQLRRGREEVYVPGERTEGLLDTLGRRLPDDRPPVRFVERAQEAGLVFRHFPAARTSRLPEDMGSGVALGDVDGDGLVDAFLVNVAGPFPAKTDGFDRQAGRSRLFRNLGQESFEDVTERSGIDLVAMGMGACFVDVDSDGDLDLFVTTFGRCRLFENDGTGRFADASARSGVDGLEGFWTGIAAGDYDRDGAMDLYVCGYVRYEDDRGSAAERKRQYDLDIPVRLNPSAFEPERNLLFHGRGDGTFEEVAAALGVENPTGRSLSAVMCDLTGDGWPDLYVANDVSDNAFFVNRGNGTFEDRTYDSLLGDYRGAMGLAIGDFDEDEDPDIFITHWIAQENALYVAVPRERSSDGKTPIPVFMDSADRFGLGQISLDVIGWATGFVDYDGDGRLDLFAVNGSTIPMPEDPVHLAPMHTQLFWNAGEERGFFEVGPASGDFFREGHVGRGGAAFDYDQDGDPDLVVVLHGERAALLQNEGGNQNRALLVRLRQPSGNRFAIGSKIQLSVAGRQVVALTDTQGSYLSQHAVGETEFGLLAAEQVEEVRVTWPDGTEDRAGPFPADSLVTWVRGGKPVAQPLPGQAARGADGPGDLAAKKRFYAVREQASAARIAGELERAVGLYREALAIWPGHADCLYYLGNSLRETGDEVRALEALQRLVAIDPASSAGWMEIGRLRLPGGDPAHDDLDAAEAAFRRCHEINGEESRPVVQLGVVALLREDLAHARRRFADASVLNPRSIEARWLGGVAAYLDGDRARAQVLLDEARALALDPNAPPSVAGEGDTRTGKALQAAHAVASPLDRWGSIGERDGDLDGEYRGLLDGLR